MLFHGQVLSLDIIKVLEKSTPFTVTEVAEAAAKIAFRSRFKTVEVFVKGPGARESAIRQLQVAGLDITAISRCQHLFT